MKIFNENILSGRIIFLDYLRIFAFLSVLVAHKYYDILAMAANDINLHVTLRTIAQAEIPFFEAGGAGVVVFFLVSGYIITSVALKESAAIFCIRRFFRIYPLFIFAVLLEILLAHTIEGKPYPPLSTIIPRITLTGDFFGTPYALGSVEWTLRIEIYFYLVIAVLLKVGAFNKTYTLPYIFMGVIIALQYFGPYAMSYGSTNGYISLFMPFLFVGSCIFLYEKNLANKWTLATVIFYAWYSYLSTLPYINATLYNSHFLTLAISIFFFAWFFRSKLSSSAWITYLSELTYSIYIFHNWLWKYIADFVSQLQLSYIFSQAIILLTLFLFCSTVHHLVEKYFIEMGIKIVKKYTRRDEIITSK